MQVNLYTTHCPQCRGIEQRLKLANIEFEVIDDEEVIRATGQSSAPILQVDDGPYMTGKAIHEWIRNNMRK